MTISHGVPCYFHPAESPELWARLAQRADVVRFAVVNPHNGPGMVEDPSYVGVVQDLHRAGIRAIGYIDTAYGERGLADVLDEATLYRDRYGLRGVFLDQGATSLALVSVYERYLLRLRGAGMRFVVLNPGAFPHPAYVDLVNVTVTFEGHWRDYRRLTVPAWTLKKPASRFCHFVYDVPPAIAQNPSECVIARHAQTACLTQGTLPNPWDRLPAALEGQPTSAARP
jgi:Spherulation-specific family 4.